VKKDEVPEMLRRGPRVPEPKPGTASVIRAYAACYELKQLLRQGWPKRGVPESRCESVAEHSFGVALLALWLAESHFPHLDAVKVLRMAVIHDLGEVDAGDITPAHGMDREEKTRRERASVVRVLSDLPNGASLIALWDEYEAQTTGEAKFVKAVDRLEMALQAAVYEHQLGSDLSEFFTSASRYLEDPAFQDLFDEVLEYRP
jgi:putative hydrolase of HD superfamily